MNETCSCCKGIEKLTPKVTANSPGLSALRYRVGTHGSFLKTMKARLSELELTAEDLRDFFGPEAAPIRPLASLTTRVSSDPAIALLDAWAVVADVLTFYQERVANEGFLRTAVERLSILELARLIGYRLRPGVAASVFLAYTLEKDSQVEIPTGARSQSLPGPGELPQSFETSEKLEARAEWNTLKPRLTRPQVITLESGDPNDASRRETLYFTGITTKLVAGDAILIRLGDDPGLQVLRIVEAVYLQAESDRTEVRLYQPPTSPPTIGTLQSSIADASELFPDSSFARKVAAILESLVESEENQPTTAEAEILLSDARRQLEELHTTAVTRRFTRLGPWIDEVLKTVRSMPALALTSTEPFSGVSQAAEPRPTNQMSGLGNLFELLGPLSVTPAVQHATSLQLPRTTSRAFATQSDVVPKLLTYFNPAAASVLYQTWANMAVPEKKAEVDAIRIKAGLFPGTFPGKATVTSGVTSFGPALTFFNCWNELVGTASAPRVPGAVPLDAIYDKIRPGSWVAIERPVLNGAGVVVAESTSYHLVTALQTVTRATDGYASRVTLLKLDPPWLSNLASGETLALVLGSTEVLHGTVVYAQAEPLILAEEPIDRDIAGNTIELDGLYAGLASGRWIIVSGKRTDIPNVTGVVASELAMLAGVTQGPAKEQCLSFPADIIPFSSFSYITDPNSADDRLVVGILSEKGREFLSNLPLPSAPNQQFCEPVQLAPGLFVDAYIPTAAERNGSFHAFTSLLRSIPASLSSLTPGGPKSQVTHFGWRIRNAAAPKSTLLLANSLTYSYDAATATIYGNVVKATHGETKNEILGSGDGSQAMQEFPLRQSPLTYLAASTPAGAASTLQVRVNDVKWHENYGLVGLGPKDRRYVTRTNDKDETTIVFGNGKNGARLPTGVENVKAVYRTGIGKPGNVKERKISSPVTKPLGVKSVINPLPATGGADREDRDQARRNAPMAVMSLDRLISIQDYEDFARTYAGIAKASSAPLSDGRRQLVHLTIAGSEDIPIATTSDLFLSLRRALREFGDPYQPIQVVVRHLKLLVISARVNLLPDYVWENVEPRIRARLLDKFSFAQRELGQDALSSEALSVMQAQPGVAYVDLDVFDTIDENASPQTLATLSSSLQLRSRVTVAKARIDTHQLDPNKRILPAQLAYLSPAVPDTLILTELKA